MNLTRSPIATVDLNMLRALDALLESASVASAAERLAITPAAASNALRRLREHFGDALLVRSGSRMVRTVLGERLREPAAEGMRAVTKALAIAPSFEPRHATGTVCVATSDHVDAVWLEPLRAQLARDAPQIEIVLLPYARESAARAAEGEVDLVIAPQARFADSLRAVYFVDEPYALVLRKGHPQGRRRLDVDAVAELPHLVVSPVGDASPTAVDRALAEVGRRRRVLRRVTSFSSGLLIVATSDLVGVVPQSFAALHASRLDLRLHELPIVVRPARLSLAWSARLHDDPLHAFVRRRLTALAKSAGQRRQSDRAARSRSSSPSRPRS
ncbi:MAG: LysR family transcriptional regulator [Deltaproteobacteria bacterium]|jgi:DNA-binding transcriptional LysR family regulator